MQNPLCPAPCPACESIDVCHSSCICPACQRNSDAYEAWKALAPIMLALNSVDIIWGWSVDTVMPTPIERYSIDISIDHDSSLGVYATADGSFSIERYYWPGEEIKVSAVWRGNVIMDCVSAIEFEMGRS